MNDIKISVIIPIYNVAPYLTRCLDSVVAAFSQLNGTTFENRVSLELLCIDDGSTDRSGALLDTWAQDFHAQNQTIKQSNNQTILLRTFHQSNQGVSSARNVGLDNATGDWIMFLDPDDTWTPQTVSVVARAICDDKNDNTDLFAIEAAQFDEDGNYRERWDDGKSKQAKTCSEALAIGCGASTITDKVFRKTLIDKVGLRFELGIAVGEDGLFTQCFMSYAKGFEICTGELCYQIRWRADSVSRRRSDFMLNKPFQAFFVLKHHWVTNSNKGLLQRLQRMAAHYPALGGCVPPNPMRNQAIKILLSSAEFNQTIIPFLLFHGNLRSRIFSLCYIFAIRNGKEFILKNLGRWVCG